MTKYFKLRPNSLDNVFAPTIIKTIRGTNQYTYVVKILKTNDDLGMTLGMILSFGTKSFIDSNYVEIDKIEAFKELI